MSSSHPPHTKIMFLDDDEAVREKIVAAYQGAPLDATKNGVLAALRDILIPISQLQAEGIIPNTKYRFVAEDAPKDAVFTTGSGDQMTHYQGYHEIERAIMDNKLSESQITDAVASGINKLLESVREAYKTNSEWQEAERLGYPEAA